jgi:hypothetical protein
MRQLPGRIAVRMAAPDERDEEGTLLTRRIVSSRSISTMSSRPRRLVLVLAVAAVLAIALSLGVVVLMQSSISISRAAPAEAAHRFAAVRQRFSGARALTEIARSAGESRLIVHREALPVSAAPIAAIRGLAWRESDRTLAEVRLPFWFVRMKLAGGRGTLGALLPAGWDIVQLEPDDLVRHGPGLLLDEQAANGDRLLLWAE